MVSDSDSTPNLPSPQGEAPKHETDYLGLPQSDAYKQDFSFGVDEPLTDAWRIKWQLGTLILTLAVPQKLVIGRALEGDTEIGLDLTPYGAYHYGVSRHHAILTLVDGFLYIEDNHSTNGTRVSGFQLSPLQKYLLRSEDEIEFARLQTTIRFERVKK